MDADHSIEMNLTVWDINFVPILSLDKNASISVVMNSC